MRVMLSNLTAIRQKTGIGHYVTELVHGLRAQAPADRFETFPGAGVEAAVAAWRRARRALRRLVPRPAVDPLPARTGPARAWLPDLARGWAAWHFRLFWGCRGFELYHEPNYIPLPCRRPTVATVHDLSVVRHPEWHPADRVAYYEKHLEPALRRCAHLLVDSDFTRAEILRTFSLDPARVTRVYIGIRRDYRPLPEAGFRPVCHRLGLPGPYLLHVGTLEPRKNLLLLLRAYCDLPGAVRERCPLVLVGGWGWNVTELASYYHNTARHRGVRHLGYVPDADLPALYNGARALVFPTHYEGFGLPPLEMMACGGAVIASKAGAVVETAGSRAHLVPADDLAGWRSALYRVATDDDWHATLRRGATDVAGPFTWERCARETYQVYQAVLAPPQSRAHAA